MAVRNVVSSILTSALVGVVLLTGCAPSEPLAPPVNPQSASPAPQYTIGEEEATQLMYDLLDQEKRDSALDRIVAEGDVRFVSVLIELIHFQQTQILPMHHEQLKHAVKVLQTLTAQDYSYSWAEWVEWYGKTDLKPPSGFTTWKGKLFATIDPRFADFLTDEAPSLIRAEEILWGGVRVDAIPALDSPNFVTAESADYVTPDEPVFGIVLNGDARAYPLRIMDWHEMANDVIGGVPVSLSYCTLCGAAIAYHGQASDGQTYTFGSPGLLFRSNKLMYDRQTRTLWNQLTAEPVMGALVGKGVTLSLLPVVLTSWKEWQGQHPDTKVLDINTGYERPYSLGAAYGAYFYSDRTMFPVWQRSDLLPAKSQVYALRIDGIPKAYPIDVLTEEKVVNDVIGETELVLVAARGKVEVPGILGKIGFVTYSAGAEVRAYRRGKEMFSPGPDADTVWDSAGRLWKVSEEALIGPGGERAPRLNGHLAYWFGWYAFFPTTLVYGH